MQWLQLILVCEAAGALVLSSLNCLHFGRYALSAAGAARRVGATALWLVNLALFTEAASFLALAGTVDGLELVAAIVLRSVLLAAAAVLSLLVWRQGWQRRR